MNIFNLHEDTKKSAQMHCDKHVVKMIIEYAQLMSTAHRILDGVEYEDRTKNNRRIRRWKHPNANVENTLYKASHINHPSAIWTRESIANYIWLHSLFENLCDEYTHRYGKVHSTNVKLNHILERVPNNIGEGWREPPPAMSHYPQCIVPGDSIASYKNYYVEAKSYFAKWTKREVPDWYAARVIAC